MVRPETDVTRMLVAAASGDTEQSGRLLEALYGELHAVAEAYMAAQSPEHTLQPTALVNEAWMKLFASQSHSFQDRHHFLATAARAMRQILVDHARGRRRAKRGVDWSRVRLATVPSAEPTSHGRGLDLEALDRALTDLEREHPRPAQVVELRFFGDLSIERTAAVLGLSERTVAREWRFARAWLSRALGDGT